MCARLLYLHTRSCYRPFLPSYRLLSLIEKVWMVWYGPLSSFYIFFPFSLFHSLAISGSPNLLTKYRNLIVPKLQCHNIKSRLPSIGNENIELPGMAKLTVPSKQCFARDRQKGFSSWTRSGSRTFKEMTNCNCFLIFILFWRKVGSGGWIMKFLDYEEHS